MRYRDLVPYPRRLAILSFVLSLVSSSPAMAQIISSAADNDMHPRFSDDGWANVVGSYDAVIEPTGFSGHAWLEPPDGNNYGGGVQFSGVPGTPEAIEKSIPGLTNGVAYAVEWYIMSDRVQGGSSEDVWFDVSFCGVTAETIHIPFTRRREWIREVQVFTANNTSCALRFAARNPSGNNSNWIFLDSVQVAVATSTDFAIAVSGPAGVTAGSTVNVSVTIQHNGPDPGTPPVVTYPLPAGTSVNAGAAGPVAVAGTDGASWSCVANGAAPQTIECTRTGAMTLGSTSAFEIPVDFDPPPGAMLVSTLTVAPTFQAGNADPEPTNDSASFTTRVPRCGDGAVEAGETCEDGNVDPNDGCDATCNTEPGFTCPTVGALCVPICGDGLVVVGEGCDDDNPIDDDGCTACVVDDGWLCAGAPSVCGAEACGDGILAGDEMCDDGDPDDGDGCSALCTVEPDFTCGGSPSVCVPGTCGDSDIASVEECDDGNMADGDGCSLGCVEEPGFDCAGEPSICNTICGDGIVRGDERCDDGDTESGDGCNESCIIEDEWACADEPSVCELICSDGVVDASEACDDGDLDPGDGCDGSCDVEDGYACTGEPSVCRMTCGNGSVDVGETCDDSNLDPLDGCDATCQLEETPPAECDGGPCINGHVIGGCDCNVRSGRGTSPPYVLVAIGLVALVRRRNRR